ncbi:N-acetylglutamate synthase, GNAT family [Granulicella rosea]|uniref:N-acetylglutamate synthase, GNAT family n=1 Tax=Granulicella rosea TaxID=474952 RepID=A0A239M876_9BACT|nr:GNAT family N-acetyltransferase [Granulicella rosea]SNT38841.1 N-acetylglutamate synthase, GNAT family [Granulicella rosea]
MSLVLNCLEPAQETEFGDLVRLYEQAFPASERKPVEALRRMLATAAYHFFLAQEDGLTAGFAIVRVLDGGDAALLEYMAVAPERRGHGLGGRIVLAVAQAIGAPPAVLLIEVESDRVEGPEREQRSRRKRFYRSLGARELQELGWVMPPVAATPPPAMEMLAFASVSGSVSRGRLRRWLTGIYVEVYGQRADDPRIGAMLAGLPDEVPIL